MSKRPRLSSGDKGETGGDKSKYSKKPGGTGRSSSDKKDFSKSDSGKPRFSKSDSPKREYGKKDFSKPTGSKRDYSKPSGERGDSAKAPFKKDYSSSDKKDYSKPARGRKDYGKSDDKGGKYEKPSYGKKDFSSRDKKDYDKPTRGKRDDDSSSSEGKFEKRSYGSKNFTIPIRGDKSEPKQERSEKPEYGKKDFSSRDKKDYSKPTRGKRDEGESEGRFEKPRFEKKDFSRGDKKDFSKPRGKRDDSSSDSKRDDYAKPSFKKDYSDSDKKDFSKPRGKRDFDKSDRREGKFEKPRFDKDFKKSGSKPTGYKKKGEEEEEKPAFLRLNRFIANAGVCSRREADELIKAGKIMVNKVVVTEMGHRVGPKDEVRYEGQFLRTEKMQYVLLNKPKGFITTTKDDRDRRTVMSLVEKACDERIYPVGRLDRQTTGLLLFTNDGALAKKLTHPSSNIKKIYQVELNKPITQKDFDAIVAGLELEDGPIKVDEIAILTEDNLSLGIEIHSGRNRIIRRIFEHLDYEVEKLDRVMIGNLTKKNLPRGDWRHLTKQEVSRL